MWLSNSTNYLLHKLLHIIVNLTLTLTITWKLNLTSISTVTKPRNRRRGLSQYPNIFSQRARVCVQHSFYTCYNYKASFTYSVSCIGARFGNADGGSLGTLLTSAKLHEFWPKFYDTVFGNYDGRWFGRCWRQKNYMNFSQNFYDKSISIITKKISLIFKYISLLCFSLNPSVLNHSTLEFRDFLRKGPRQFKLLNRRIFGRWFRITPHDVGLKCLPDKLWTKNCFGHVTWPYKEGFH